MLIAVDRFGAVVFQHRSPLMSPKLCLFFIPATWIIAMAVQSPYLFVLRLVEHSGKLVCTREWKEVFEEFSFYANYVLVIFIIFLLHSFVFHKCPLLHLYIKGQVTTGARREFGQGRTTGREDGTKCVEDGHCYCAGLCSTLGAIQSSCSGNLKDKHYYSVYSSRKLCYQSLHLF